MLVYSLEQGKKLNILKEILHQDIPVHGHTCWELIVVFSGSANHIVDGKNFPIKAGDIFIIGEEHRHGYTEVNNLEIASIGFVRELLFAFGDEILKNEGFQSLFATAYSRQEYPYRCKLHIPKREFGVLNNLIYSLCCEQDKKMVSSDIVMRAIFIEIIIHLTRYYDEIRLVSNSDENFLRLIKVVAYMESFYNQKINITELAKTFGFSQRSFNRLFTEHFMQTPKEYIINIRIKKSIELLQNGELNLTEIAQKSGFYDSSDFYKHFKKLTNLSPNQYRSFYSHHK